jgi:simple sugar transport system permease protein
MSTTQTQTESSNPIFRFWRRISPSLVPVLAVLTAMILTIPLMVITGGKGDIGRGLNIAFTAYASLIEGSVGVAVNQMLSVDDVALVQRVAENAPADQPLNRNELRSLNQAVGQIVTIGLDDLQRYEEVIRRYEGQLDSEQIDLLGARVGPMIEIGAERLEAMRGFVAALGAAPNVTELIRVYGAREEFSDEDRAVLTETVTLPDPSIPNDTLLDYLKVVHAQGTVRTMERIYEQFDTLGTLELAPLDADARTIEAIAALSSNQSSGSALVLSLMDQFHRLEAASITEAETEALANQLLLVDSMYTSDVVANADVRTALNEELPVFLANNFTVYRPGNQPLLINRGSTAPAAMIWNANNTPDNPDDDRVDTVYAQLGNRALLFFPFNLERMLTRAIPYVIAGLAVALCFKAGLFNIGAEGQLYMGAILAVWVGFSPAFDFLPGVLRLAAMIVAGAIGGGLWGFIPGALKAFTGAHEVINTIMLNFIAIKFVEWMIRSKEPYILRDPAASVDQTPNVVADAILPRFTEVSPWLFVVIALIVAGILFVSVRSRLSANPRLILRPILYGLATFAGLIIATALNVRGSLHLGLVIMFALVFFVQWFLDKTTPGYALQTVGANSDAARYAGMSVKWNLVLAMMIGGGLAGLAGAIEMSGVQFNMKPGFFSGLGFDAISVALLARSQPRNMIFAGLLWGALLSGAGLMQVRADISIDLVRIIQALIILFIAADAIVRWLWRIPEGSESGAAVFTKGWAG